jgi:hypothetical protein
MKKYIFFIFALIIGVLILQKSGHKNFQPRPCWMTQENAQEYVEQIYGKNGVNLSLNQLFFIQEFFLELLSLSPQEQSEIALRVIQNIDQQLLENPDVFHTQILTTRKNHLERYVKKNQNLDDDTPKNRKLAQQMLTYMQLENDAIFSSPKNMHLFYAATKSFPLPQMIDCWKNETLFFHNDQTDSPVKIQLLESFLFQFAMDMTIAIIVSQGASLASSMYASQSQKLYARLMENKKAIESNMKAFLQKSQSNQQESLQTMISLFSQTQEDIQKKTQESAQNINAELAFLHKNISLEKPQQNFLFAQTDFDTIFTNGDIPTNLKNIWKDPFKVGAWQYNKAKKSFIQTALSPLFIDMPNDAGVIEKSAIQAENNSIFTEFHTHEKKYSIQGVITIHQVEFPFFTGIIFNKGRWISGNYESIRKCRMLGIYGASPSDISICFAEQYLATDEQMQTLQLTDPIQTPLQQIIQNNKKQKSVDPVLIKNISIYPLQIAFTITTQPTQVTISTIIDQKKEEFVITKLNPQLFISHGIGCISPNAQADFMFQAPQSIMV